ncbi:hypothetical protein M9Y10_020707 [Tritrichomonas musculus]|uniref:Uncharacterized protein n=1 Tax=Tritrichomonas musculus TaxID=1915356 RepID=A0ABR2HED6_9EUKA
MIGIIVGCVAAAAVIAGLVAFFVIRKRKSFNLADDISGVEDQQSAVTTDNSFRRMMTNDDPFQNEFENKDSTKI